MLTQLGQRGLADIHVGVPAQMHRADLGRNQHRGRLTHHPTSSLGSRIWISITAGDQPGQQGHHLTTGGVWQRPPPLPRRRRCQLWKRELDCVRGYSQGAQIGSPSRNRWREQGQAEPILPLPRNPGRRRNPATRACSAWIPSPSNTSPVGAIGTAAKTSVASARTVPGAAVWQLDHQQQHAVPPLEPRTHQQLAEQRMHRCGHPHIARQHRPKMLQSVAITSGTGKTHLADRAGHPGLPSRPPGTVRHRLPMGRPARRGPQRRPAPSRARSDSPGIHYSSSTRSATSPSRPKRRTCSSSSSPHATNTPASSSPPTSSSDAGAEVFGDDVVAAAMIDRLVHHADVVALKGDSYRLRNRDLGRVPTADPH